MTTIEQAKKIVQTIVLEEMEKDLGWQALACTWLLFRIPIADFYEYTKTTFLDFLTLFPSFCIYTTFTRYDKKYSSTNTFNIFLKKKKEKRNNNQRRYDTKTRDCSSRTISHSPSGELDSLIFNNFHQLFVRTSWTDGPSTISLPPAIFPPLSSSPRFFREPLSRHLEHRRNLRSR